MTPIYKYHMHAPHTHHIPHTLLTSCIHTYIHLPHALHPSHTYMLYITLTYTRGSQADSQERSSTAASSREGEGSDEDGESCSLSAFMSQDFKSTVHNKVSQGPEVETILQSLELPTCQIQLQCRAFLLSLLLWDTVRGAFRRRQTTE